MPVLYPVCFGNRKIHDEYTHLGPSTNCETCKQAKMKEKSYIKKDMLTQEERDDMRSKRREFKFNHHITFDSFGQVPQDINGNEFGTVGLCSNTKFEISIFRTEENQ